MKFLVVGLGNVGAEYLNTRHNIGFKVVDELAHRHDGEWKLERHAFYTSVKTKGRTLHLIKPTTFMNRSGKAVRYWMQELKISLEQIVVVVDDLAIPFGKLRLRSKGSDGGHNGLKDINAVLGRSDYARLRFGIGDDFFKGQQISYVLGEWSEAENEELPGLIDKSSNAIESVASIGVAKSMNLFN